MKFIGEDDNIRKNCLQGDIITNGNHMGVMEGNSRTISESYSEKKFVRNSWDFRGEDDIIFQFIKLKIY